jgi:uncharacterized protein (DUF362 family)/Pyruvate/2-oxoacid:ferredoxin oxidoreductase delta subunit
METVMDTGTGSKTVSLIRCDDYTREKTYLAVKQSIELLGGLERFVSPGQRVFLKFNLLLGSPPGKCVTTHPEIVYSVARLLKEYGCDVILGDSPGSGQPYTEAVLKKNYLASGFDVISRELAIPLNYDTGSQEIPAPDGKMVKRFCIINPALDADAIVVVSKAKTHTLTFLSAAAKNLFGVIPGYEKPFYHGKMPEKDDFCRMIVDLNEAIKPKLQITDAIMAMEGDGPHAGTPRKIGAVLASGDYTAIDVITARLMAFDPMQIGTIKAASERGLISSDFSDISVLGEDPSALIIADFKHPSTYLNQDGKSGNQNNIRRIFYGLLFKIAGAYPPWPKLHKDRCTGCMNCVRSCPKKTISIAGKKPKIDYSRCIRCYCCHEMCDSNAISLERGIVGKIIALVMRTE